MDCARPPRSGARVLRGWRWRWAYLPVFLFPPLWSYVAIYRIDAFGWAAGPAVAFLSLATFWTGWVFFQYRRRVASSGAALLGAAFCLWSLHHLDYPFLRARGAWTPWGYYLDMLFELWVGAGILLLVLDDLRRGLGALAALSGELQRRGQEGDLLDALLARQLTLPAVRGAAMYLLEGSQGRFVRGVGVCAGWPGTIPAGASARVLAEAAAAGRPAITAEWLDPLTHRTAPYAYAAVLPIFRGMEVTGALVMVGDARDPFAALDEDFLVALGQQVGAALENADLYERLQARTVELARLSARILGQHEEERRRLSRELHDETAQVFSAVKIELGVLRDDAAPPVAIRLDRALNLIDTGIRSIRAVTNDLRPSLLDDLGLIPALRSLTSEFADRSRIAIELTLPAALPELSKEAELALFRALQEALSNVARHAAARTVSVQLVSKAQPYPAGQGRWPRAPRGRGPRFRAERPHGPGRHAGTHRCARGQHPARRKSGRRGSPSRPGTAPGPEPHMTGETIRVLVADDHTVVREGIRYVLEREPGFEVVAEAGRGSDVVALAEQHRPDVAVLDISMPGESGIQVAARLRQRLPETRILILSMYENAEYVLESVRAGAHGYRSQGYRGHGAAEGRARGTGRGSVLQSTGRVPVERRGSGRARTGAALRRSRLPHAPGA